METMSETDRRKRPLHCQPWSVRKLLQGRKQSIYRRVEPQPPHEGAQGPEMYVQASQENGAVVPETDVYEVYGPYGEWGTECPYGTPGNILRIKEPFRLPNWAGRMTTTEFVEYWRQVHSGGEWAVRYEADGSVGCDDLLAGAQTWGRRRGPDRMPEVLSRIRLLVRSIETQKVQSITQRQARRAGFNRQNGRLYLRRWWCSRYGPETWKENDWAWCIEVSPLYRGFQ